MQSFARDQDFLKEQAMPLDFESVADAPAEETPTLDALRKLIEEANELDKGIDEMTFLLDSMASRYNFLKIKLIPDIMTSMQSTHWRAEDGTDVEITDFVTGSLPKEPEKHAKGIQWLIDNNGAGLIKTTMSLEFGKSQHNEALALAGDLRKAGHQVTLETGVNHMTLQANVRERLRKGEHVDLETLGIFAGRVAKITHAGKNSPTKVSKKKKVKA